MDFLGIGPLELLFILIIALLVLGPKQMVKTGGTIGEYLRKFVTSDSWKAIRMAQREMRSLPNKLAREAGINEWDMKPTSRPKVDVKPKPDMDIGSIMPELDAWTKPVEDGGKEDRLEPESKDE